MKIIPIGDRIVLSAIAAPEKVKGILLLPDDKGRPKSYTVRSIGQAVKAVKSGDEVIIDIYAGKPYTIDDQEYLIAQEKDILAKVDTIEA